MATQAIIPIQPDLPPPLPQTAPYLKSLYNALYREFFQIKERLDVLTLEGTLAEQPAATGSRRFYWVSDGAPARLEYDSSTTGTWNAV